LRKEVPVRIRMVVVNVKKALGYEDEGEKTLNS
jgi:hypothetical protein